MKFAMVDICLELPDSLLSALWVKASLRGMEVEDLLREALETNALGYGEDVGPDEGPLSDEPIVQAAAIEKEYRRLGYRYGWRFMTCPQARMESARLLLVSLNPAGRQVHGPAWSQETGSAYRVESWDGLAAGTAPLQPQVQLLFDLLGLNDEEVFSAHYVPFRSPSWADLEHKAEAETFAKQLWLWLRPKLSFDKVVCIGKERPGKPIAALLDATFEASLPVGWGDVTADRYRLTDGRPLIALPHLSRFGLFGRPQADAALRELFQL